MPLCGGGSAEEKEAKRRDKEIARQLKRDQTKQAKEIKLLLLGAGESGKSTIVKQMRIIHGGSYSDKDKAEFRSIIFDNTLKSMKTLVQHVSKVSEPGQIESANESHAELLLNYSPQPGVKVDIASYAPAIKALWEDSGVKAAYAQRNQFQLNDSAKYYFGRIDDLAEANYLPNLQDILRSRVATTGIVEYKFHTDNVVFRMVDVGGQRSERRKWIHCFEGVTSILFVVGTSGYDTMLFEDNTTNRMEESLDLFDTIVNYQWFEDTSMILFLNKKDLLQEKLETSPLKNYFESYKGDPHSVEDALQFFQELFREKPHKDKAVYFHPTCATDTSQVEVVFSAVKDTVLNNNLRTFGLV